MKASRKREVRIIFKTWATVPALLLVLITSAPALAGTPSRPLPPQNPWAADRPDDVGGKINLGWSESPTPGIAADRVYRSQTAGGPYRYVGKHSTDAEVNYLAYVDTDLTDGVTYYYVITAVDRQGRESGFSAEVHAVPSAQLARAAVKLHKSMVISLADQKLYCMENGRVVHVFLVSTGTWDNPTPTGNFRILYHDDVHPVPKYPGTVCHYWMGFFEDYAIHAWPIYDGVQGDYSGLGHPASHGCVRLDPTLAHIPYYWAPDGTPLSIIAGPFQAPPSPLAGGDVAQGTPEPSKTWFFAEGYTGGEFDEYILVLNPNPQPTGVDFDFMRPDGSVYTQNFPVGANARMTVHVDDVQGMAGTDVSVRLRSELPVVAERSMYFNYYGIDGGHVSTGASQPSNIWYYAEGYTGGGFDEYILVQNPNPQPTGVDFDFMRPDGSVYTQGFQVGPQTRMTVSVDNIPNMAGTDVSVRLRSGLPVVAERAMYFGYSECPGGSVSTGCVEPTTTNYMAEGYTNDFFDTYLLIMNPQDTAVTANITFCLPSGQQVGWSPQIGAHSRYSVQVNLIPGLSSTEFSIKTEAKVPVVVERAMYFNFPR
jgi:lipoprotein-anchoring transpeptidase ErfK/SrfK